MTLNILSEFHVFDFFDGIVCVDSTKGEQRSKSEMIAGIIEDFKISPDNTVYIGDTVNDFDAANGNNIEFIGVVWGYGAAGLNSERFPQTGQ